MTPDDEEENYQINPDHSQATPDHTEVAADHDEDNSQVRYGVAVGDLGVAVVVICGDFGASWGSLVVIWGDLAVFFFVVWGDCLAMIQGNPGDSMRVIWGSLFGSVRSGGWLGRDLG